MKIRDLIPEEQLRSNTELLAANVDKCTANHRTSDDNALLFLLPGVNFDTYTLASAYSESKCTAIVTEDASKFSSSEKIIEVKNARLCFAHASSKIAEINYGALTVIGVTGTNGKTTSATMILKILADAGIKCGFIGTGKIFFGDINYAEKNYSMTSPDPDVLYPILRDMQKRGCSTVVLEASSHALALDKLSPIPFKIGIFTGMSHEHLEFHKTMENYFLAKARLIDRADIGIVNCDDEWGKKLYEKYRSKAIGVGILNKSDAHAFDIKDHGILSTEYRLKYKDLSTKITLSMPGIYNVYNSLLAFVTAYCMNVKIRSIKDSLLSLSHVDGRFETIMDDITVVIDYAHTPYALESLLKTVKQILKPKQKITLIFGCGGERDPSKRPLMARVAERYADRVIVTNDNPRGEDEKKIFADIEGGFTMKNHGVIRDRALAIEYAIKNANDSDIVVIAGKGHEKYIRDKNGVHEFDEKSIVINSLKLRNEA